ncbi:MAG TPA: quinohemoprotein amine dehydrogenase subunit alpha [Sneathiellales bacterium]|nr:quinohemoprotein amine dehydrogenase subunit alpha [Sneathiellales bacterium]
MKLGAGACWKIAVLGLTAGWLTTPEAGTAQELDPRNILEERCSSCHTPRAGGGLERISDNRKTPEGWEMTIVRMGIWHGVEVPEDELAVLVRHLSNTQGLAPAETAGQRFILERQPNVVENIPNAELNVMCARCHSFARVALQRQDEDEWRKQSHAHLGQYPTTEYQSLGRDRDWWGIARDKMPKLLGEMFPLKTDTWDDWRKSAKADISGSWRVHGERPGVGRYVGSAEITATDWDEYEVTYALRYANGSEVTGQGAAIVYTGFEWRGSATLGDEEVREVFALSEDGNSLSGRWFLANADEVGAHFNAVRVREGASTIIAVEPQMLRAGESTNITIHGFGLKGNVSLGDGVTISEFVTADANSITVVATAATDIEGGNRSVSIGSTIATDLFSVYSQIDRLVVEPPFAIARVGGGTTPAVVAQFTAVAYLNGPDGEAGTNDDVRLGSVPAEWSIENFSEEAEQMEDAKYVGTIDQNGTFMPAGAGPNPERKYKTNNAGRVTVKANAANGESQIAGDAEMVVTVQRWNSPPIL